MNNNHKTIGFIGTGVMGKSMAGHILNEGHKLLVYNRTQSRAKELVDKGAVWIETVGELAEQSDIIITMVGYPQDVKEVYLGEEGILNKAKKGTYAIDMTTSSPILARDIHSQAIERGIHTLDAPVSGGDVGAQQAKLAIMVGGLKEDFDYVKPILELMGTNIVLQGGPGSGQHTKMCNQIAIASNMIGVCEAILYAEKAGLDPNVVLQSIETGAAGSWSLSNLAPRMIKGDFEPGFYIKHFIKDMKIAIESAEEMKLYTPGLRLAKSLYEKLEEDKKENKGTQALYLLLANQVATV
ncbi:NAD(P)-dependent oxidoreductase [Priestia megaterium]|jgi:3-hydroxyisobutyrate dehydrogenase|uniref:NAD(P)-dependent oxidoreductase n=2 Tax=Priestia megaterium TaxID=1404 RepID=UPI000BEE2319|nr:NAD(P)-dependent oxidoreductase [Priestia megaterium]MDP9579862.1 3-hydroxyisobutyrate dehydrogenase [Bacillus sp. 1751]MDH2449512.1 NAD(P)-dependent oxidoreductase [Priestia megaterium]MDL5148970.1 NAD(P)-dependent oxidoreductase [Priestia megaterium]MED4068429.1 NAD(P)-dependent oxidoreductase [Priestia megaterium]PEA36953.1 oxidoreductase [Priestia megaterium]